MSLLTLKERLHLPAWDNPAESRFPRVEIDRTLCDGCELCALVCPVDECITMEEVKNGKPHMTWQEDPRNPMRKRA